MQTNYTVMPGNNNPTETLLIGRIIGHLESLYPLTDEQIVGNISFNLEATIRHLRLHSLQSHGDTNGNPELIICLDIYGPTNTLSDDEYKVFNLNLGLPLDFYGVPSSYLLKRALTERISALVADFIQTSPHLGVCTVDESKKKFFYLAKWEQ